MCSQPDAGSDAALGVRRRHPNLELFFSCRASRDIQSETSTLRLNPAFMNVTKLISLDRLRPQNLLETAVFRDVQHSQRIILSFMYVALLLSLNKDFFLSFKKD